MNTGTHAALYPPESAGRLMAQNVPTVHENAVVGDIEQLLLKETKNLETIHYIYVLDKERRLKGVVSLKEVFRSAKQTPVKTIMQKELVLARAHTDQERVALLALQHNVKAIPVVNKDDVFLGAVPSDVILRVLHNEAVEDMLRFGGVLHSGTYDDTLHLPITTALIHRLPWLILGLVGGMVAAGVISSFEGVLSKNIILAAFIPLIMYMASAVGTQMQAFIIRDLMVTPGLRFARYLARQTGIVLLIGLVVSLMLYAASLFLHRSPEVSLVLAVALFIAVCSALFTGLVVPYLFNRLRFDPANASGPVATIIQDIASLVIYFAVAALIL